MLLYMLCDWRDFKSQLPVALFALVALMETLFIAYHSLHFLRSCYIDDPWQHVKRPCTMYANIHYILC
jgi:hypothetical protein